eukprot:m.160000 g.160000  ORF g.160000 m.160000 type:complete len:524 (-) comp17049_c0_seq1:26-1597(-)
MVTGNDDLLLQALLRGLETLLNVEALGVNLDVLQLLQGDGAANLGRLCGEHLLDSLDVALLPRQQLGLLNGGLGLCQLLRRLALGLGLHAQRLVALAELGLVLLALLALGLGCCGRLLRCSGFLFFLLLLLAAHLLGELAQEAAAAAVLVLAAAHAAATDALALRQIVNIGHGNLRAGVGQLCGQLLGVLLGALDGGDAVKGALFPLLALLHLLAGALLGLLPLLDHGDAATLSFADALLPLLSLALGLLLGRPARRLLGLPHDFKALGLALGHGLARRLLRVEVVHEVGVCLRAAGLLQGLKTGLLHGCQLSLTDGRAHGTLLLLASRAVLRRLALGARHRDNILPALGRLALCAAASLGQTSTEAIAHVQGDEAESQCDLAGRVDGDREGVGRGREDVHEVLFVRGHGRLGAFLECLDRDGLVTRRNAQVETRVKVLRWRRGEEVRAHLRVANEALDIVLISALARHRAERDLQLQQAHRPGFHGHSLRPGLRHDSNVKQSEADRRDGRKSRSGATRLKAV